MIENATITYYHPKKRFGYCRTEAEDSVFFHLNRWRDDGLLPSIGSKVQIIKQPSTKKTGEWEAQHIGADLSHLVRSCKACGDPTENTVLLCDTCRELVYSRFTVLRNAIGQMNARFGVTDPKVTLYNPARVVYDRQVKEAAQELERPERWYIGKTRMVNQITFRITGEVGKPDTWRWQVMTEPPTPHMEIDLLDADCVLYAWMGCQLFGLSWHGEDLSQVAAAWARLKRGEIKDASH